MKREKQQPIKIGKRKFIGGIVIKLMLAVFSFGQANWVSIACAASTVTAATMFGDKGYMAKLAGESQTMLEEGKTKETIKLLESKITEYFTWREKNIEKSWWTDKQLSDLYFQLAKANKKADVSNNDLLDTYKKALFSIANRGNASVAFYENISDHDYASIVNYYIASAKFDSYEISRTVAKFENTQNWPVFKLFINAVFDKSENLVACAKEIELGLNQNGIWLNKYTAYCKDYCKINPQIMDYLFEEEYKLAKNYIQKEQYKKAAEIYESIIKAYDSDKVVNPQLKFDLCYSLFNAGEYDNVIAKLDSFIKEHRTSQQDLVKKAALMKGKTQIQLGDVKNSLDTFLNVIIENPELMQHAEANFYIGYCYMLQNEFAKAKDIFNLVLTNHPKSIYAYKAKLCLAKIENANNDN